MMLGADSVVAAPPFAVDVAMNARAAVPGLWALWYNDDPAIGQLFREWGEAWVEDAARADKGKPPGIIPPAVRFDNDEIGGYSENWYDPLLGWDYYPWGYFSGPTEMYLHLTGMSVLMEDSSFVTPLRESLRYALATPVAEPSHAHPAGSPPWISSVLRGKRAGQSDLASIVALADQHSADPLYREFLRRFGRPIERFRYSGDTSALLEGYQRIVQALRVNFPLRTSEVKFTDRIPMEGVDHLFAAGTGGGGWAKGFPSPAVTWEGTGREVAVLVTEAGRNVVRARLFNCGPPTTVQARLWQVPEGTYRVRVTHSDNGRTTKESSWRFPERGARYAIPVPTGVEVEVVWELAAPDPMASRTRPDLALTTRDIVWHGDTLVVPVHNIGSADAARVRLTVSESGLPNVTVDIPLVSASLDLAPSVVTVRVPIPRHAATVFVDVGTPEREITLVNNRVTLRRETP
jgi:hypothetical protein